MEPEEQVVDLNEDPVARAKIDGHIDVCTERYGNLWNAVSELKRDMNSMSNRVFMIVSGAAGAGFLALASVTFYLLTREHFH